MKVMKWKKKLYMEELFLVNPFKRQMFMQMEDETGVVHDKTPTSSHKTPKTPKIKFNMAKSKDLGPFYNLIESEEREKPAYTNKGAFSLFCIIDGHRGSAVA
jgi:heat shock protein HspQ